MIPEHDFVMQGYFSLPFIGFMLNNEILTDLTSLCSVSNFNKIYIFFNILNRIQLHNN